MELRFLGEGLTPEPSSGACTPRQIYSTLGDRIETEASEQTGHFLGQKYQLRRPITINKQQLGLRKYRGVAYGA